MIDMQGIFHFLSSFLMRRLSLVFCLFALSLITTPSRAELQTRSLSLGSTTLIVEVARTAKEQARGLMFRESLPENHGMLFIFSPPRHVAMWMKNTPIDLDAAFIDRCGRIVRIAHMKRHTTEQHGWPGLSAYVLEVNAGWFERNAIAAGTRVPSLSEPTHCDAP
jgi:uncharacterized membrane protein (UPF0127 family)